MKTLLGLIAVKVFCEEKFDLSKAQLCGSSQRKTGKFGRKKIKTGIYKYIP